MAARVKFCPRNMTTMTNENLILVKPHHPYAARPNGSCLSLHSTIVSNFLLMDFNGVHRLIL